MLTNEPYCKVLPVFFTTRCNQPCCCILFPC